MCVNRLYIQNNKLDFNPLLDRFYNYVPCGQCEECMANKAQDYETRAIYEYESNISTFYYTFTYNNEHLPHFQDVPVFSKYDVQCFLKRLRKNLNKYLGLRKFTYFISSEYGGKTLRPHYHALFFFPEHVFSYSFYKLVLKSWQNGFIYPGKNLGRVIGVVPCRYVAKYVQKDSYQVAELDKKNISKDDYRRYLLYKNTYYYDIDILPFHLQSSGFGVSMLSNIKDSDMVNGYVVRNDAFGISRRVKIPQYIYRKRCYEPYVNKNGNISYVMHADAFEIWKGRMLRNYDHLKTRVQDLFNFISSNYSYLKLPAKIFLNYENFKTFASDFVNNEVDGFVSYQLLYSGYTYIPFGFTDFRTDLDIFINHQLSTPFMPFMPDTTYISCNNFDRFKASLYDMVSYILEEANLLYSWYEYQKRTQGYNVAQVERSRSSGRLKLVHVKTLNEFKNYKQSHLCLNILNTKANRLKCPTLQTLLNAS